MSFFCASRPSDNRWSEAWRQSPGEPIELLKWRCRAQRHCAGHAPSTLRGPHAFRRRCCARRSAPQGGDPATLCVVEDLGGGVGANRAWATELGKHREMMRRHRAAAKHSQLEPCGSYATLSCRHLACDDFGIHRLAHATGSLCIVGRALVRMAKSISSLFRAEGELWLDWRIRSRLATVEQ